MWIQSKIIVITLSVVSIDCSVFILSYRFGLAVQSGVSGPQGADSAPSVLWSGDNSEIPGPGCQRCEYDWSMSPWRAPAARPPACMCLCRVFISYHYVYQVESCHIWTSQVKVSMKFRGNSKRHPIVIVSSPSILATWFCGQRSQFWFWCINSPNIEKIPAKTSLTPLSPICPVLRHRGCYLICLHRLPRCR